MYNETGIRSSQLYEVNNMIRFAILGTENSHAAAFASLLKEPKYADLQLVGVYGRDIADPDMRENEKIAQLIPGIEIADRPDAFLGKVDAVVVTARHGTHHYEYAMPYIKAGLPCFIDKPFAVETAHALEMIEAAKASGALLCGGSCLKFAPELEPLKTALAANDEAMGSLVSASFVAPVVMDSPYAGFFFYSQHLIAMMLSVFGCRAKSVFAVQRENSVTAIFRYPEADITLHYGSWEYGASLYFEKKHLHTQCAVTSALFDAELEEFLTMVKTSTMPETYEELIYPVILLQAINTSMNEGREVVIAQE